MTEKKSTVSKNDDMNTLAETAKTTARSAAKAVKKTAKSAAKTASVTARTAAESAKSAAETAKTAAETVTKKAKPLVKKAAAATDAAKDAVKSAGKKRTVKKAAKAVRSELVIQYGGHDRSYTDLLAQVRWELDQRGLGDLEAADIHLYVKPEENMVYYVVNEDVTGSFSF